jgi:hypothetical protein
MAGLPFPSDSVQVAPPPMVPEVAPARVGAPPASNMSIGGVMAVQSVESMMTDKERLDERLQLAQAQPVITGLAAHIKGFFVMAESAKQTVKDEMIEALYARQGKYTPEKLSRIAASGQPAIYMMLAASKMRQAESLFRDVLIGSGTEKPWTAQPTRVPDLPQEEVAKLKEEVTVELTQAIEMGLEPTLQAVRERLIAAKVQMMNNLREAAQLHMERMEDKMEDQLQEGGFDQALDEFITDLTTFKTAFVVGPIVRKKPKLSWSPQGEPVVEDALTLEWERADPFDIYPAPWAKSLRDKSPLIRKHRLSREAIQEMRGVEGYSDDALVKVLELYGDNGLAHYSTTTDSQVAIAEGKNTVDSTLNSGLIDALQFWGSVSGKMLLDWGMTSAEVPDASKEYQVEAWLVGPYVIKAVLNGDPLARRPIYGTSFERIPGSVWGRSPYDLIADCQDMCNASARSLAANMGIASGPQVGVDVSRLPPDEDVTQLYPWKVWQFTADPMGSTAAPLIFFQPESNAAELMTVYERFASLADEYTGIPKYMTGSEGTPGAGRTASGLSMMIGNASKIIKQVVGAVDQDVIEPLIGRLFYYNMRFSDDPELKGDVQFVARGAMSLTTKDSAQVRLNEILAATNNPTDMEIIGLPGRAEMLRKAVSTLDMNVDKIVPPTAIINDRVKIAQMQQAMQAEGAAAGAEQPEKGDAPQEGNGAGPSKPGQALSNGAPQTDNFSPSKGA